MVASHMIQAKTGVTGGVSSHVDINGEHNTVMTDIVPPYVVAYANHR